MLDMCHKTVNQTSGPQSRAASYSEFPMGRVRRVPLESKIEVYTQTDDEDSSQLSLDIHTEEVLPLQTEILMPRDSSQFLLRHSALSNNLNSSGSDLEDLILDDFENENSFYGEQNLDVSAARSSETENNRDVSLDLGMIQVCLKTLVGTSVAQAVSGCNNPEASYHFSRCELMSSGKVCQQAVNGRFLPIYAHDAVSLCIGEIFLSMA